MFHEFIAAHHDEIITRCLAKTATRSDSRLITAEINHGVPAFLDQLLLVLRLGLATSPEIGRTATLHGQDLLLQGRSVSEVVHDYGDVCQSITELAVELDVTISAADFRILNRCLDDAIAGAVTEYARDRQPSAISDASAGGSDVDRLAHELRNLSRTALLAFDVIKTGNVGVTGSTGTMLHRSLMGISALTDRWLSEVRPN